MIDKHSGFEVAWSTCMYVCVCVGVINVLMLNVKYMYMCVINVCSYSEPRLHSIATIYQQILVAFNCRDVFTQLFLLFPEVHKNVHYKLNVLNNT